MAELTIFSFVLALIALLWTVYQQYTLNKCRYCPYLALSKRYIEKQDNAAPGQISK